MSHSATVFAAHMYYLDRLGEEIREDSADFISYLYYYPLAHPDIIYRMAVILRNRCPELEQWPAFVEAVKHFQKIRKLTIKDL